MTAELEPLTGADAEVLGPPLAGDAARKLDGRIRRMAKATGEHWAKLGDLVAEAKHGQVHTALGFPSWPAYLADAVGGHLELTSETRREVVALMAGEGMSLPAIGQATGVSKSTVANDLAAAQVSNGWTPDGSDQVSHDETPDGDDPRPATPATVTGLDGRVQTRAKRRPKSPSKPDPFQMAFGSTVGDVHRAAMKLAVLMNGKRVSAAEHSRLGDSLHLLDAAIASLTRVREQFPAADDPSNGDHLAATSANASKDDA